MKLVDDKGKLFGVANIFDLVVVLSILAIIVAGALIYMSRTGSGPSPLPGVNKVEIVQTYLVREAPKGVSEHIKEGDRVKDAETKVDLGEVVAITKDAATVATPNSDGELVAARSPVDEDIQITVRGEGRSGSAMIAIGGTILEAGEKYTLKTRLSSSKALLIGLSVDGDSE